MWCEKMIGLEKFTFNNEELTNLKLGNRVFKSYPSLPLNSSVKKILNPQVRFGDMQRREGEEIEISLAGSLKRTSLHGHDEFSDWKDRRNWIGD